MSLETEVNSLFNNGGVGFKPTDWKDGGEPAIDAEQLNRIETALKIVLGCLNEDQTTRQTSLLSILDNKLSINKIVCGTPSDI